MQVAWAKRLGLITDSNHHNHRIDMRAEQDPPVLQCVKSRAGGRAALTSWDMPPSIGHTPISLTNPHQLDTPVEPKPPAPRSVALNSSTSCTSGVAMRSSTSWAMRSPFSTVCVVGNEVGYVWVRVRAQAWA